jgi:UDP-GlcNAc3NAcA epimerase
MNRNEGRRVKIVTVVGARPQFVKAAPVSRELNRRSSLQEILVHTGQHHDADLSERQFVALGLRSADLNLGIHGGTPGSSVGRMISALDEVIGSERPDAVLVYGDTNSTVAAALASANRDVPVLHVEAGLRSFERSMPEERNRVVTDHLATLRFVPTYAAIENLRREGIVQGVHHVGDVMLDAFLELPPEPALAASVLAAAGAVGGDFVIATLHRAQATADRESLASRVRFLLEVADGRSVVLPLHPRTRAAAAAFGIDLGGLRVIDPVDYRVFSSLLAQSSLVATDSGGVQKEAYFHRVPCVTLRNETEWPETISAGWNRLWTQPDWLSPRREIPDYGDGQAAAAIADVVEGFLADRMTEHGARPGD